MKKTISILLFASIILSVFATATNLSSTEPEAPNAATASTTVSLSLSENYATVWFSKGANTTSIASYSLSLKNPDGLVQNTAGNSGVNKIYATGENLYLNWNIVSSANVLVTLTMTSPLAQDGASDSSKKIGWKASWDYSSNTSGATTPKTITLNDTQALTDSTTSDVFLKNGTQYGDGRSKKISITTDNVWYKDKTNPYTATLTATIKTTS